MTAARAKRVAPPADGDLISEHEFGQLKTAHTARTRRLASWGLMAIVVAVALFVGANAEAPPSDNERVQNLASSLACPRCDGQSIADSDAPIARELYADIGRRVDDGETDDQIRDAYRNDWGESVLLTPAASGVSGLVWVLPVVALALAVAGLSMAFLKWSKRAGVELTDEDADLVAAVRSS